MCYNITAKCLLARAFCSYITLYEQARKRAPTDGRGKTARSGEIQYNEKLACKGIMQLYYIVRASAGEIATLRSQ